MVQFNNPIIGEEELIRSAIKSQNYQSGATGWRIAADGTAEFNNVVIRNGSVISGVSLYYNGVPAFGNLVASIAATAGTDPFGNSYDQGFTVYGSNGSKINVGPGGGASRIDFTLSPVGATTWDDGVIATTLQGRLGTNTPLIAITSPRKNGETSQSSISLFGYPETSNGDVTNEIVASTLRFTVLGGPMWANNVSQTQTYTPTWSGLSALGTGFSSVGRYWFDGAGVTVVGYLIGGTGTSLGTGSITASLPVNSNASVTTVWQGTGRHNPNNGGAWKELVPHVGPNSGTATLFGVRQSDLGWVTPGTAGYTWVAGSMMSFMVRYEY